MHKVCLPKIFTRLISVHSHLHFVFGGTMSKNRFRFWSLHIVFDTPAERAIAWPNDCFAAFRTFWEMFNSNLSKPLIPSEYLWLDETLYPMPHQIAFRQYNPMKPCKFLILKCVNRSQLAGGIKNNWWNHSTKIILNMKHVSA